MEHFTAAQGAGWGTGFGLEDASQPGREVIPSQDFTKFVSTHLGWEPEEPVSANVAAARFAAAEAANDHLAHAGGFGEGLVTVSATGVDHIAAAAAAGAAAAAAGKAAALEGRKELETGVLPAAKPAAASSRVIPQESINTGNPLSNSLGVADPGNLLDTDTTSGGGKCVAPPSHCCTDALADSPSNAFAIDLACPDTVSPSANSRAPCLDDIVVMLAQCSQRNDMQ